VSPSIGHGGRNRMRVELKMKYCNITNETIVVYLSLCVHCQKNLFNPKKGQFPKTNSDVLATWMAQKNTQDWPNG